MKSPNSFGVIVVFSVVTVLQRKSFFLSGNPSLGQTNLMKNSLKIEVRKHFSELGFQDLIYFFYIGSYEACIKNFPVSV